MLRTSQIVAGTILVPYIACGFVLCLLVMDRKHCNSMNYYFPSDEDTKDTTTTTVKGPMPTSNPAGYYEDRFCAGGYHGLLSLLGTLLIGFTIIIYRLLNGTRTKLVKYIHLILHASSLVLFSIGMWSLFTNEYSITYDRINYHGVTSWFVFGIFCLQIVVATLIYIYQYPNTELRLNVAPFHDIMGIWLFICFVACCISGKRRAQLDYVGSNTQLFNGLSYVCFTCILIIILSPFYEWDVVGPI